MSELIDDALGFCDEIEEAERESIGWGYQWEHLGDASKDVHKLMWFVRELAAALAACEKS